MRRFLAGLLIFLLVFSALGVKVPVQASEEGELSPLQEAFEKEHLKERLNLSQDPMKVLDVKVAYDLYDDEVTDLGPKETVIAERPLWDVGEDYYLLTLYEPWAKDKRENFQLLGEDGTPWASESGGEVSLDETLGQVKVPKSLLEEGFSKVTMKLNLIRQTSESLSVPGVMNDERVSLKGETSGSKLVLDLSEIPYESMTINGDTDLDLPYFLVQEVTLVAKPSITASGLPGTLEWGSHLNLPFTLHYQNFQAGKTYLVRSSLVDPSGGIYSYPFEQSFLAQHANGDLPVTLEYSMDDNTMSPWSLKVEVYEDGMMHLNEEVGVLTLGTKPETQPSETLPPATEVPTTPSSETLAPTTVAPTTQPTTTVAPTTTPTTTVEPTTEPTTTHHVEVTETYGVITLSFDSKGGSEVPSITVQGGEAIPEPQAPTLAGYHFLGWYYVNQAGVETKFDFLQDRIYQNFTVYAKWRLGTEGTTTAPTSTEPLSTQDLITITFDSQGGPKVESVIVKKGELVPEPHVPQVQGHTFKGWVYEKDGFNLVFDFANTRPTESMILKADWDPNFVVAPTDAQGRTYPTNAQGQIVDQNGHTVPTDEHGQPLATDAEGRPIQTTGRAEDHPAQNSENFRLTLTGQDGSKTVTNGHQSLNLKVQYADLVEGGSYELRAWVQSGGEPLGQEVTHTFKPEASVGSFDLALDLEIPEGEGNLVAVADLYYNGTKIYEARGENEFNTLRRLGMVHKLSILQNGSGHAITPGAPEVLVQSEVSYTGLVPGETYYIQVAWAEGTRLLSGDGMGQLSPLAGSETVQDFIPQAPSGVVQVQSRLQTTQAQDYYAMAKIADSQGQIVLDQKTTDENVRIGFVSLTPELYSEDGSSKEIKNVPDVGLLNKVGYRNLDPNQSYIVKAHILDLHGQALTENTLARIRPEANDGVFDLVLRFNAENYLDQSVTTSVSVYSEDGVLLGRSDALDNVANQVKVVKTTVRTEVDTFARSYEKPLLILAGVSSLLAVGAFYALRKGEDEA